MYMLQHGSLFVTSFVFLMGLLFKVNGVSFGSATYKALSSLMLTLCVLFLFAWGLAVVAGMVDRLATVSSRVGVVRERAQRIGVWLLRVTGLSALSRAGTGTGSTSTTTVTVRASSDLVEVADVSSHRPRRTAPLSTRRLILDSDASLAGAGLCAGDGAGSRFGRTDSESAEDANSCGGFKLEAKPPAALSSDSESTAPTVLWSHGVANTLTAGVSQQRSVWVANPLATRHVQVQLQAASVGTGQVMDLAAPAESLTLATSSSLKGTDGMSTGAGSASGGVTPSQARSARKARALRAGNLRPGGEPSQSPASH
jgi:hypothetical protein